MPFRELLKKEVEVAIHGQSAKFRMIKYICLGLIIWIAHFWMDWIAIGKLLIFLAILAMAMHFFYRWKTHGWKDSWGGYKPRN